MSYSVELNEAATIQQELVRVTTRIETLLADLQRGCRANLTHWEGGAQSAYLAAEQDWNRAAGTMRAKLNQSATTLTKILEMYSATDRAVAQGWTQR